MKSLPRGGGWTRSSYALILASAFLFGFPGISSATPGADVDVLVLPGATYNSDDGVGGGFIASFRRPTGSPSDARPYVFDVTGIVLGYFNPHPNAWGLNWRASWYPSPSGDTELEFLVHSIGWRNAWFGGLGNGGVTESWRRNDEDPTIDPWHRYGLFDLTLGARVEHRLPTQLAVHGGLLVDFDHLVVRPGTFLAAARASGEVLAPEDAVSVTGELGLSFDTAEPSYDPTQGGTIRGALYLTGGSAGVHGKALLDLRGYVQLGRNAPVVLAGTILGQIQYGDIPFYELSVLGDPAPKPRLVTGGRGLRGLRRGALRGPLSLLMMSELRFRLPAFAIKKLRVRTELVASADAAMVATYGPTASAPTPNPGFGGGIRVILNEQLVVHVDVATAPSDHASPDGMVTEWGVRGYASVGHIF